MTLPLETNLHILAADWTNPTRARAALTTQLRMSEAEVERLTRGIVVCLAYAGRHDGRVPAPMLRRVLGVER